jgi:hypothetical protein
MSSRASALVGRRAYNTDPLALKQISCGVKERGAVVDDYTAHGSGFERASHRRATDHATAIARDTNTMIARITAPMMTAV